MVLEKLVTVRDAIKNPWWMLVIGGVVAVISLFLAFVIFPTSVGLFMVFLITFAMTPFMVSLITYEEVTTEEEIQRKTKLNFFQRHSDVLQIYVAFFSGMVITLSIVFIMLPDDVGERIFENQITEINLIRGSFSGLAAFPKIVINNFGVLVLSFLFAFLFGSGAIFILAWNASVLAAAIGIGAKSMGGITALPVSMMTFLPHGIPEMVAYFLVGIAGGLISAGLTRRKTKWFKVVLKDSGKLVLVAAMLLVFAAIIETMIL